jgi:hypothetical protein
MSPRARKASKDRPSEVKTSLYLPEQLWRAAKIRALEEGVDLRDLIIRGLKLVVGGSRRGGR